MAEPNTLATICEGVMPATGKFGWTNGSPLDTGKEAGACAWNAG